MPDPTADPWASRPWRLLPSRVSRFYRGGLLLDRFRGEADPRDTDRPEDWVGSATRAWTPPGTPETDEGLSEAEVGGEIRRVADIDAEPGVLVKLLDAGIRLPVHAHPTREFAQAHLGSSYGKTEAWVILATRVVPGEPPPNVRLGFRRDVSGDELLRWIEADDQAELLGALHTRSARPGDAWLVPAGTPHAIGAGVLILEVQEPSDFSIVLETAGFPIRREDAHLGLGWDVMLDAIDRRGRTDAAIDGLRSIVTRNDTPVLVEAAAPFFAVRRFAIAGRQAVETGGHYAVGAVLDGAGVVRTRGGELAIGAGDTFAIPASAGWAELEATEAILEVLVCTGGPRPAP
jgi:mannose-6-phosphate isomerase